MIHNVIIIGGGAAGFYAAIHMAEQAPDLKVIILEKDKKVLSKVKISGGGRCNVTHGSISAEELAANYPRGQKELLGPFHVHGPENVVAFFEARGVPLKTEEDGRIFPTSNSSQTVIDCLVGEAKRLGVEILKSSAVQQFQKDGEVWKVTTKNTTYTTKKLLVATGSNTKIWKQLEAMGHRIIPPVPSLFTFNSDDERLKGLQGTSQHAFVTIPRQNIIPTGIQIQLKSLPKNTPLLKAEGPVLITHCGLSGPAILKLSAWGANILHDRHYTFKVIINWTPEYSTHSMQQLLKEIKSVEGKKTVLRTRALTMPRRLWTRLVKAAGIDKTLRWADASKEKLKHLAEQLTACSFEIDGKSTFKEEFVTAGGVDLKEINFKTFESKIHPNLYFAGEVINVDAVTGGFNFQNAWTGAYIAAKAIVATSRASQQESAPTS